MAFNWQTFRTRSLSAVVFVLVMAIGLLWNRWTFLLLFSVVHFGCWIEYHKLVRTIHPIENKAGKSLSLFFMLTGWGLFLFLAGLPIREDSPFLMDFGKGMMGAGFVLLVLRSFTFRKNLNRSTVLSLAAGLLYISLSLGLLLQLRYQSNFPDPWWALYIPLLIVFTNWINDTMAYIVGSMIGKTPLSPISPKKTWEGTIGGAILAVITISLIAYFSGLLPVMHAAALAALGAISGTYGDLFESKLKRLAGVKDSGNMMPGHGGFLDRFDSLLFSATIGAIYVAVSQLAN